MKRTTLATVSAVACAVGLAIPGWAEAQTSVTVKNASELKSEIVKANARPAGTDNSIYLTAGTYLVGGIPHIKRTIRLIGASDASTIISGATNCAKSNKDQLPGRLEYLYGDGSEGKLNQPLLFDPLRNYEVCLPRNQELSFGGPDFPSLFTVDRGGYLWLQGVTVRDGMSTTGGGAVRNEGTLMLNVSTLAHNHSSWGGGGAVYNAGTLYVYDSTIRQNFAHFAEGGGIFNAAGGYVEISHSTISGNAGACAGGIYNGETDNGERRGGPMSITNSTISNNKAVLKNDPHALECGISAGGILNSGVYQAWLKNVTVTENFDFTHGKRAAGGIAGSASSSSRPGGIYPLNTLVVNNFTDGSVSRAFGFSGPTMTGTRSQCYGTVYTAGGNVFGPNGFYAPPCLFSPVAVSQQADLKVSEFADPGIDEELRDNGGNTCTHALRSGSVAANHGWPKGSPGGYDLDEFDQRWVKRQGQSDIGAYSFTKSSGTRLGLNCTAW